MIVGMGLDLVELSRVEAALFRFGDRLLKRVLTPAERQTLPPRPLNRVAGIFAAKEAAVKALGTGFALGIGFAHLEILRDDMGRPLLSLSGPALDRARAIGATSWHVSITHARANAAAVVVLEREEHGKDASGGRGA